MRKRVARVKAFLYSRRLDSSGRIPMLNEVDASELLGRAEMHEQLAATTHDGPARKMHLAMAAEYRRRAAEMAGIAIAAQPRGPRIELTAQVG